MSGANGSVERLLAVIAAEGSPLSDALVGAEPVAVFGPLMAKGSRTAGAGDEYFTLVEAIFEGYLLHYGSGRTIDTADEDLRLLGGDFLYAHGLSALARLGDGDAIEDLSGLIALCAQASRERPRRQAEFGQAYWALTCLSVAGGRWPGYSRQIAEARQGKADTEAAALPAARRQAESIGLALELESALIAFNAVAADQLRQT